MGNRFSQEKCNYHCPICRLSGKIPNIAGKFIIINENKCQCNACNYIFDKNKYYYNNNIDDDNTDCETV
jgi:rubredoxin